MRVQSDDDIKRVDRRFLGPKGRLLIVRTSYRNWGIAITVIVLEAWLWSFLDLPTDNEWIWAAAGFATLYLIKAIQNHLQDEVTVWSTAKTLFNDAKSPSEEHVSKPETMFLALAVPIYQDGTPKITSSLQRKKFEADEKFDQKLRARFDKNRYVPYVES